MLVFRNVIFILTMFLFVTSNQVFPSYASSEQAAADLRSAKVMEKFTTQDWKDFYVAYGYVWQYFKDGHFSDDLDPVVDFNASLEYVLELAVENKYLPDEYIDLFDPPTAKWEQQGIALYAKDKSKIVDMLSELVFYSQRLGFEDVWTAFLYSLSAENGKSVEEISNNLLELGVRMENYFINLGYATGCVLNDLEIKDNKNLDDMLGLSSSAIDKVIAHIKTFPDTKAMISRFDDIFFTNTTNGRVGDESLCMPAMKVALKIGREIGINTDIWKYYVEQNTHSHSPTATATMTKGNSVYVLNGFSADIFDTYFYNVGIAKSHAESLGREREIEKFMSDLELLLKTAYPEKNSHVIENINENILNGEYDYGHSENEKNDALVRNALIMLHEYTAKLFIANPWEGFLVTVKKKHLSKESFTEAFLKLNTSQMHKMFYSLGYVGAYIKQTENTEQTLEEFTVQFIKSFEKLANAIKNKQVQVTPQWAAEVYNLLSTAPAEAVRDYFTKGASSESVKEAFSTMDYYSTMLGLPNPWKKYLRILR